MTEPSMIPSPPAQESLAHAFARHEAYLRGRLRGLGVAESGLDDAVQDVFEVLVRRFADYDRRFSLRQWMAGVARKIARRHRERSLRAPEPIEESTVPSTVLDPERWTSQQEALAGLQEFLNELDRDRWAVFVLSEIEGLRGTEIAAELGVNLNTVYARLRTAREAFERAMRRRQRRERPWLVLPLFGNGGAAPVRAGAFVTPIVLIGLVSAAVGGVIGVRGCNGGSEESAEVARGNVDSVAMASAAEDTNHRSSGVASSESGLLARPVPVAGEDGWIGGPGGSSSRGEVSWSHRERYRLSGDELILEIIYTGDPKVAVNHEVGWVELEQFEQVEGPPSWPVTLAAGETKVVRVRVRAKASGIVRLDLQHGQEVHRATSGSGYVFVLEGGALRRCEAGECRRGADSVNESATGHTVTVTVRNECERAIEAVMIPCLLQAPPVDAQAFSLQAGESRVMTVDESLCLGRRKLDGSIGSQAGGSDGFIIRFLGDDCGTVWAEGPDDKRLGIPGPQR